MSRYRVLVSSFQCQSSGTSESYVGYNWLEQIARFNDVTLLTADTTSLPDGVLHMIPAKRFVLPTKFLRNLNGEVKLDYFWFNSRSMMKFRRSIGEYDLVHHVAPIAPRYPCGLGSVAKKFILGPVGGGLRVPTAYRMEVEKSEEFYFNLRKLDRLRLKYDPFLRKTFAAASRILIVGKYMFDILPEEYHAKCLPLLETGIDADSIDYSPLIGLSRVGRIINFLYVGRVVPYKGLIYALRAIARLPHAAKAAIRFHVVGDCAGSGYETLCRRFMVEHDLTQTVILHGPKSRSELHVFYEECDLFLFPSLAETSGNVVLEAMSKGRPVLAFNCGGPPEIVSSESGYLVEPGTPEQAVETIKNIIVDIIAKPEQLVQKGANARRVIEEKFVWKKKGEFLNNLYEEVLMEKPASA